MGQILIIQNKIDGESLMEGEIEVTLSFHRDASSAELPL